MYQKLHCQSILVVEDNSDVRETLQEALQHEGYPVYTCKNGREALVKLRQIPGPALVLLDLMMPVMNGWQFLESQQANDLLSEHQVVILSAVSFRGKGVAGSLTKPVNLKDLLDQVQEYCGAPPVSEVKTS